MARCGWATASSCRRTRAGSRRSGWTESDESKLYDFSPHTAYFQTMGHYDCRASSRAG